MAGRGEGLVPGDLRAGDAGAVHAFQGERIAAFVDDADGLQYADLARLADRGGDHVAGFFEFQLEGVFIGLSLLESQMSALSSRGRRS